eukprot:TRINITY_DN18210_c0_g1_i1.p1 TRINITY_DN18210_c0_g1~~TRINITY_DN18210_c0_g1_i1.p1  ORF type:complete len:326 (+),score=46.14 TRINITY_DN18210_c0_g1_i1:161-1138(+)
MPPMRYGIAVAMLISIVMVLMLQMQVRTEQVVAVYDPTESDPKLCLEGPGVWCSDHGPGQNCSQAKTCALLPESVHAQVKPNDVPWWKATRRLRKHAHNYAKLYPNPKLLFLGDSITETLRGTFLGNRCKLKYCQGFPNSFTKNFGSSSLALGIGGDRTEHLLYRLLKGELDKVNPETIILLIGTNNIRWGHSEGNTTMGILSVVKLLCFRFPQSKVLVLGILPRGDCRGEPGDCTTHLFPNRRNTAAVNINSQVASQLHETCPSRGHFLDCGQAFINEQGNGINSSLMEDSLHPGVAGFEKMWDQCLKPALKQKGLWDGLAAGS